MMEIRVLKYFLAVAREENITRAAALLHITQPTLSRQLMQMEEELGIKLFRRSKHSIVLTEEGMLLRRRAQEIVDLAKKIGTFDISIRPYEDCCTIFVAKHPETRPKTNIIEAIEKKLEELDNLIKKAVETEEIIVK